MGLPSQSTPSRQDHWAAKVILLGIASLFLFAVVSDWVPEKLFIAVVLTISLVWVIRSEFRSQWTRKRFRVAVPLILGLHLVFLWAVMSRVSSVELSFVWTFVIPEGMAIFVLLWWLAGTTILPNSRAGHMQRDTDKDFTFWEWVILLGLAAIAVAVTEIIGLSQKWEDVVVFTVVLFTVVLLTLHELWRNPTLWRNLLPIFGMHIVVFAVLADVLRLGPFGFPKVPLIAAMMAEGVLIIAVLWKRARGGHRDNC